MHRPTEEVASLSRGVRIKNNSLCTPGANIVFGTAVIIFEVVTMSKDDDDDAEVEGRMLRG